MFINIYIYSKNKVSLIKYLEFLNLYLNKDKLNFKNIILTFKKQTKTTIFTVLKSPHVNKTAQTHFENRVYRTQLTIYSNNYLKLIYFIKYFSENNFSDIKIKIKVIKNKNIKHFLNYTNTFFNNKLTHIRFFKLLDFLGELKFKN